jgi:hypothetical protein
MFGGPVLFRRVKNINYPHEAVAPYVVGGEKDWSGHSGLSVSLAGVPEEKLE